MPDFDFWVLSPGCRAIGFVQPWLGMIDDLVKLHEGFIYAGSQASSVCFAHWWKTPTVIYFFKLWTYPCHWNWEKVTLKVNSIPEKCQIFPSEIVCHMYYFINLLVTSHTCLQCTHFMINKQKLCYYLPIYFLFANVQNWVNIIELILKMSHTIPILWYLCLKTFVLYKIHLQLRKQTH